MFSFHLKYFILMLLLLIAELIIAAYVHDALIRPFGGDFLVVILIYCFVKSFLNAGVDITALGVLLFAYLVEISQYFHLINRLGLQRSAVARALLGTTFSWSDMLIYSLAIFMTMLFEKGYNAKINMLY